MQYFLLCQHDNVLVRSPYKQFAMYVHTCFTIRQVHSAPFPIHSVMHCMLSSRHDNVLVRSSLSPPHWLIISCRCLRTIPGGGSWEVDTCVVPLHCLYTGGSYRASVLRWHMCVPRHCLGSRVVPLSLTKLLWPITDGSYRACAIHSWHMCSNIYNSLSQNSGLSFNPLVLLTRHVNW